MSVLSFNGDEIINIMSLLNSSQSLGKKQGWTSQKSLRGFSNKNASYTFTPYLVSLQ